MKKRDPAGSRCWSGRGGIRTHGTEIRTQHFQCCTFSHSVTRPVTAYYIQVSYRMPIPIDFGLGLGYDFTDGAKGV